MGPSGWSRFGVARGLRGLIGLLVVVGCVSLVFQLASGGARGAVSRPSGGAFAAASEPSVFLQSVSCSSRDVCTAVGQLFMNHSVTPVGEATPPPVAERWNGRSWSVQQMPAPSTSEGVDGLWVSCPTNDTCFAVGDFMERLNDVTFTAPLVERWAHGAWEIQQMPDLPVDPGNVGFDGVACTAANACMAVGGVGSEPLIERWNGSTWSRQPVPPAVGPIGPVSCTSRRACLAIGFRRPREGLPVVRWNGSRWRLLHARLPSRGFLTGSAEGDVTGLSCTSMRACVAVGGWFDERCPSIAGPTPCGQGRLAWRWDGSRWSMSADSSGDSYANVSCVSSAWCLASSDLSSVRHWDGTRWSTQTLPHKITLNYLSCVSKEACIGVGSSSVGVTGFKPLAVRWNGKRWIDVSRFSPG